MLSRRQMWGHRVRRSAGPRDEPSEVFAGAVGAAIDREARGLHRALCCAVRAATAGDAGPRGLDQVLYPGPPGALGPDVLQHSEGPSGTQDASHLVEARGWIVHAAEDQAAQNGVERRVTERQRLRARLDEPRRGGAAPRAEKRV